MSAHVCFVSYHELGLKGKNRPAFQRRLAENIAFLLPETCTIRKVQGRILVDVPNHQDAHVLARRIARIPGVANVSPATCIGRDLEEICHTALRVVREMPVAPRTFRVTSKRSNTDFKVTSQQLNIKIGQFICDNTDLSVDLSHPDLTIRVTVVGGQTYVSGTKMEGAGGLPVGSSGILISLLSSGIDSPVATWRMIRRGAVCVGLHFSGAPVVTDGSHRLALEIGDVLARTGGLGRIYTVAFGQIQREIASTVYPDLRILTYRRTMMAVAQALADIESAHALVTGESLGQVASQTIENIVATGQGCTLPIFRPLIGDDKHDIVAGARRIDTFELSAQAADDCCTLFMPRTPETHVDVARFDAAMSALDIDGFVMRALETIEYHDYPCNQYKPPKRFPKER